MPDNTIPPSSSSGSQQASNSIPLSTPPALASSPLIIYRHISEIPLYLFEDAICDDKIHSIVVSGHPTEQELADAWNDLLIQYNERLGDSESRLFFSLHKQILQKEITLQQVDLAIVMLKEAYVPELLEFLNGVFFTRATIDAEDCEDRDRKLNMFKNQKASIRMAIDMKRIQYEAIKKKKGSAGQKPDHAYFQTNLLNLSDFAKYEVTNRISVFQYTERMHRLIKFLETVK